MSTPLVYSLRVAVLVCVLEAAQCLVQSPPLRHRCRASAAPRDVDLTSLNWRGCLTSILQQELTQTDPRNAAAALSKVELPTLNSSTCFPVRMPTTALTTLLENGFFPGVSDPYVDTVIRDALPDISDQPDQFTLAYATTINITTAARGMAQPVIRLNQANYRVNVYVDGAQLAPLEPTDASNGAVGMFRRWYFLAPQLRDVGVHGISLLVLPPDHPGNGSNTCSGCGQGGNHALAQDVTSQYLAGWDWAAPTPDRSTGCFDHMDLMLPDSVLIIRDPVASVNLTSVDVTSGRGNATLTFTIATMLTVPSVAAVTNAVFQIGAPDLGINVQEWRSVRVFPPFKWVDVTFRTSVSVSNASLWWPHTLGTPTLWPAYANVSVNDTLSHSIDWALGIRTVASAVDPALGGRVFTVNGQRVFLEGGNWIAPDQLNRFHTIPERWYMEVQLHAAAGLNLIRLWGGGGGAPEYLYDAADAAGVLVMHEFWMSGDNNGRWAGNYSWPLDHTTYLAAANDTASMLRGHASLLFYCGGNELYPEGMSPPPDIAAALPASLAAIDVTGRTYVPSSMSNATNYTASFALAPADGPYGIMDERTFFMRNPGMVNASNISIAFQPEIGNTVCPEFTSLARFLSPAHLGAFPGPNETSVNVDDAWTYHKYLPFTEHRPEDGNPGYDHLYAYGTPSNTSEYALFASLAQIRQYTALYEGFQQYLGVHYDAVIMWKTQTPWPSLRGALYDWYLAPTGSFWGVRAGTGGSAQAPGINIHVQLNQLTAEVAVVNKGLLTVQNVHVVAQAFDLLTGQPLYPGAGVTWDVADIPAHSVTTLPGSLVWPSSAQPNATLLFRLSLSSPVSGGLSSGAEYWLSNIHRNASGAGQAYGTLQQLRALPPVALNVTARISSTPDGITCVTALTHTHTHGAPAFAVRVSLENPSCVCIGAAGIPDARVLPVLQSADAFALLPGEARTVTHTHTHTYTRAVLCGGAPSSCNATAPSNYRLVVTGWNVARQEVVPVPSEP